MRQEHSTAPLAQVTLRAYHPAPARIELVYLSPLGRLVRALLSLVVFWGLIPLLMWVPPHYPWILGALIAGAFFAHRHWTGRYQVSAFAGLCPRCGQALSLGIDHAISLPHTLTCYHCHFEPQLEVRFAADLSLPSATPSHYSADCVGLWRLRWLADEPFLVCDGCLSHSPATLEARRIAEAENERASLLHRLASEGRTLL